MKKKEVLINKPLRQCDNLDNEEENLPEQIN
jgi:hypothetical protein